MGSLFMPDHFIPETSSDSDVKIASIAFGFQLGFSLLTGAKAASQALRIWRRVHRVTPYVAMMWAEIIANTILGALSWLYLVGVLQPSFAFFFVIVTCWCIELQCLIQIIRNRIALLIHNDREKSLIKWISFAIVLGINISVYVIWVPARLQISPFWINLNNIWDRIEKVIFLLLDLSLNIYFIVLVKRKLLASGVTKYYPLFRFNIACVVISLSLDVLLIGIMSLPNGLIYAQFHPVVYMCKLNIEMSMASLIGKIARSQDGSTPSGPSAPGEIKLTNPSNGRSGGGTTKGWIKKSVGVDSKSQHGIGSGGNKETGFGMPSPARKRFDPSVSEIIDGAGGEDGGERMYHAWVSANGRRASNAAQGGFGTTGGRGNAAAVVGGGHRGRTSAVEFADSHHDLERNGGGIRKETEVHVVEEDVDAMMKRDREPSEDGSTVRLT